MKKFPTVAISFLIIVILSVISVFVFKSFFTPINSIKSFKGTSLSSKESVPEKTVNPIFKKPVAKNEIPVGEEWFDDAIFIGDSLTEGISAYNLIDKNKVIASTGINPQSILTKACVKDINGKTVTVLEALSKLSPKKIYIMLGSNGVAFIPKDKMIELYGEFVDGVKKSHPDSQIYLQSILPVTSQKENSDDRYANSKIDEYNDAILKMAGEKEVYYLNIAESIKDANGCLPSSAGNDGMHFGPKIYNQWLDYLREHYIK